MVVRSWCADHSPRPRSTTGSGYPERILTLGKRPGAGGLAGVRKSRNRLRPVGPTWKGFSHRQSGPQLIVSKLRRPKQISAIHARGDEGQSSTRPSPGRCGRTEEGHASTDRTRLAARTKAVDRPVHGTRKLERLDENLGSIDMSLRPRKSLKSTRPPQAFRSTGLEVPARSSTAD